MRSTPGETFASRLHGLTRVGAFPFPIAAGKPIQVIQTHASAVMLAGERAYKLKKPENFGFFDYSTPDLRRHFCSQEVRLNARLAPDVYLGVAPVLIAANGAPRFGPPLPPEELPQPGAAFEDGEVVDYAVVMRRLPEEATLQTRVLTGTASAGMLDRVARHVAAFHATSETNEHIADFGSHKVIAANWEENFQQMRPYIGRVLEQATFDRIEAYARQFLAQRATLLEHRVSTGRIRDCHGDLRLQHVYLLDAPPRAETPRAETPRAETPRAETLRDSLGEPTRIAIVDCIEFNERFRYSDVAAELAFLTMELDLARRADLSRAFVTAYVEESGDEELRELLPFYACYRACVRGKVLAFQLDEPEVPAEQRIQAQAEAHAVFDLAAFYAGAPVRPTLLLVGGLMGSGKSTLAAALSAELGWQVISSDVTRKRLTRRDLRQHDTSAYGEGIYNQEWTARTYAAMLLDAQRILAQGRSVILDASFSRRRTRNAAARIGIGLGAQVMFAECVCPDAVALDRLRRRWASQPGEPQHNEKKGTAASVASDGRPELYSAQRASWEPFVGTAEPHVTHTLISTDQPLASSTNALFDALTLPRLVCWL